MTQGNLPTVGPSTLLERALPLLTDLYEKAGELLGKQRVPDPSQQVQDDLALLGMDLHLDIEAEPMVGLERYLAALQEAQTERTWRVNQAEELTNADLDRRALARAIRGYLQIDMLGKLSAGELAEVLAQTLPASKPSTTRLDVEEQGAIDPLPEGWTWCVLPHSGGHGWFAASDTCEVWVDSTGLRSARAPFGEANPPDWNPRIPIAVVQAVLTRAGLTEPNGSRFEHALALGKLRGGLMEALGVPNDKIGWATDENLLELAKTYADQLAGLRAELIEARRASPILFSTRRRLAELLGLPGDPSGPEIFAAVEALLHRAGPTKPQWAVVRDATGYFEGVVREGRSQPEVVIFSPEDVAAIVAMSGGKVPSAGEKLRGAKLELLQVESESADAPTTPLRFGDRVVMRERIGLDVPNGTCGTITTDEWHPTRPRANVQWDADEDGIKWVYRSQVRRIVPEASP